MSSEKHEFQKFVENQLRAAVHLARGLVITTFGTLWNALKTVGADFQRAKNWYQKTGVLIAILIILLITYNAAADVFWKGYRLYHRSWYEQQFLSSAEQEVKEFFKLYSKKFAERDCDFMRKVGVDEAMYDKYGRTQYDDYDCNNYYNGITQKYLLPFEIEPSIDSADKRRIRGKMIVVRIMEDGRNFAGLQHFEIWKKREWDLWRFNASSKQGSTKIPLGLIQQE